MTDNIEYVGGSTEYLKTEIGTYIYTHYTPDTEILDVGAGGGTYAQLLPQYKNMDAVEVWEPSIKFLKPLYRRVYNTNILDFNYPQIYDLIIFGDILEHLTVEEAQNVLEKAKKYARQIIVGVPYMYKQDAIYGNEAEVHKQDDLTHDLFMERYPGFEFIMGRFDFYGFYILKKGV